MTSDAARSGLLRRVLASGEGRTAVTLGLALIAASLGLVGWTIEIYGTDKHGLIEQVGLIIARTAQGFAPNPSVFQEGNSLTRLSALLGLLATLSGAALIAMATLSGVAARAYTRFVRRGHTVIVGDAPLARRLAEAFHREGVVEVVSPEAPAVPASARRLAIGFAPAPVIEATGLTRARRLLIDAGTDADTIALAKPLFAALARKRHRLTSIALRIAEPEVADALADTLADEPAFATAALPRPVMFDENLFLARETLRQHPLFVLASRRGQRRVHALIIGFGDLGQKLMDQIMLTSLAGDLITPRVSVLDREADKRAAEMRARRLAVLESLPIALHSFETGAEGFEDEACASMTALSTAIAEDPLTAIFVCLPGATETNRAVLLIKRFQAREGKLIAPIFYRSRREDSGAEAYFEPIVPERPEAGAVPMLISTPLLARPIGDPVAHEALARAMHEDYVRTSAATGEGAAPWPKLKETYRRANTRAADHLPAKLFTLGLDPRIADDKALLTPEVRQRLASLATVERPTPDLERLSRIEHERWMIDRKLDGWRFGEVRDNTRRIHPLLRPWEDLDGALRIERRKDAAQVVAAVDRLLGLPLQT